MPYDYFPYAFIYHLGNCKLEAIFNSIFREMYFSIKRKCYRYHITGIIYLEERYFNKIKFISFVQKMVYWLYKLVNIYRLNAIGYLT